MKRWRFTSLFNYFFSAQKKYYFFEYLIVVSRCSRLNVIQVTYRAQLKFLIKLIGQSSSPLDQCHLLPGYANIGYAVQGFRQMDFSSTYWTTVWHRCMFSIRHHIWVFTYILRVLILFCYCMSLMPLSFLAMTFHFPVALKCVCNYTL